MYWRWSVIDARCHLVQVKFLLKLMGENYMCNAANWKKVKIFYLLSEIKFISFLKCIRR